jgi:hypothetical protein
MAIKSRVTTGYPAPNDGLDFAALGAHLNLSAKERRKRERQKGKGEPMTKLLVTQENPARG